MVVNQGLHQLARADFISRSYKHCQWTSMLSVLSTPHPTFRHALGLLQEGEHLLAQRRPQAQAP